MPGSTGRAGGLAAALIVSLLVVAAVAGLALVYRASVLARAGEPLKRTAEAVRTRTTPDGADPRVELRVTQRFGGTPMLDRRVAAGTAPDVLALLSREIAVTTSYGGGFVGAIGGVASGYTGSRPVRTDWFYYVNGLQSRVGAADVAVGPGDRIWWDFHRWDFAASAPAVVGQYPAPFTGAAHAERPTRVVYARGFEGSARAIASALSAAGATATIVAPADAAAVALPGNVILLGRWAELGDLSAVRGAAASPGVSGVFVRFSERGVECLGELGSVARRSPKAGAVLATAKPDDPDAVSSAR